MYKIVKTKDFERLNQKIHTLSCKIAKSDEERNELISISEDRKSVIYDLRNQVEALQDQIKETERLSVEDTKNSVRFDISDDLTSVVPSVKVKKDTFDKMVELGYLTDAQEGNTFSMQLALLHISYEALQQIIESFEENVSE